MADYQRLYKEFQASDIGIVMASVNDKATNQALMDRHGVDIPFAYGLDAEEMSRAVGCHYNVDDKFIEATGFLLQPDATVYLGAYSTGVLGRIRADNALSVIRYYQTKDTGFLPEQD
ncbi:MAG: hypothetical protein D6E12_09480 [Desulfovibrio sp.]|nr:MAG: hypothetical protein D6E12_09480 [Desulfovibrio sp.]